MQESLTGYMILRAPDALRLYGMSETGQKAFDVAVLRGKVTRLYRAPFLKDDRVLDLIADAAQKIFLLRPVRDHRLTNGWAVPIISGKQTGHSYGDGYVERDPGNVPGVEWFWAGRETHLRWLQGDKFSACFMNWTSENGVYAPRRIHFRSEEGPYPYELKLKLIDSKLLPNPPLDSVFEAPR
jgi:hypothetical protein